MHMQYTNGSIHAPLVFVACLTAALELSRVGGRHSCTVNQPSSCVSPNIIYKIHIFRAVQTSYIYIYGTVQ